MITKRDIMNLESLLLLMSVTQHSNKRKASETLNTSVDTINKYIDNLEHDLSLKLLYSDSRGTNLTEKGKKIVESAAKIKDILTEIYSVAASDHEVNRECAGEVKIAMSVGVNANLRPECVRNFFDEYPKISIESTVTAEAPTLDDMAYDIAITYNEPNSPNVVVIRKFKVDCGFFASPDYLDEHGYPRDMAELLDRHHIITTVNTKNCISGWKEAVKKAKTVNFSTTSAGSLAVVVKAGMGVAAMPLYFKKEGLVCLDNLPCESSLCFYLCAHKNVKDIPRVRAVINFYLEMLEKINEY